MYLFLFIKIDPSYLCDTCITMRIYAKNLAGDLLVLDVPSENTYTAIRCQLAAETCSDEPSRLVILSRTRNTEKKEMTEEALTELLDEICLESKEWKDQEQEQEEEQEEEEEQEHEQEEEQEQEQEQDLETDWQDGDLLEYMIQDSEPLSIHLFEQEPLYTMDDRSQNTPYFWMRLEVRRQAETIHEYAFLFRLQDGIFFSKYAWKFEMDDREVYVEIRHGHKGYRTIWEMLDAEEQVEDREPYLTCIRRAVRRKWIRLLRRRGQIGLAERRLRVVHPSECIPGEKQMWRDHYWAMRCSQRRGQGL